MYRILSIILALVVAGLSVSAQQKSTKEERLLIKEGNAAFGNKDYGTALRLYEQALDASRNSEAATFNRAAALYHIGLDNQNDTIVNQAVEIYKKLGETATTPSIQERANYNLGNIAFQGQQYKESIEYYKKVLRSNPNNMRARENLRVAQLKLPPEDQNQDQDEDQQDEQQQEQPQQQQPQQQQPQQEQPQMSQNAEQILQTMQNRENQTRQNAQPVQPTRSSTDKPW